MSVNISVGTEALYKNNYWMFLSMLIFAQKQKEIYAGLIENQYAYLLLDNAQFIMITYIFKDIFTTRKHAINHAIHIVD